LQNKPETWSREQLLAAPLGRTRLIVTPSVAERARKLPFDRATDLQHLPDDLDTLIVVGGGTLLDQAKLWRAIEAPRTRLVAIPSIWGSGAEVSPVAVADECGAKDIHVGDRFIPDIRCIWPELADDLPETLARHACGDAWSHALEGFLSPLADAGLQEELAEVIREMTELPLSADSRWFDASARACSGQARSSVGLVHGIAHTLEGPLRRSHPDAGWGHARLCSVFVWPVMEFNRRHGDKWRRLADRYALDEAAILETLQQLHEPGAYQEALPLLDAHWTSILKDPCSRTNSVLVRPASKSFFTDRGFL
jgi:alcohol dehydrogenase class IV